MNNQKGFTLVELLAGLTVIGICCIVLVYLVNQTMATDQTQIVNVTDTEVYSATNSFVIENDVEFNEFGYTCITVKTLVDFGYLNNKIDPDIKNRLVKVTKI